MASILRAMLSRVFFDGTDDPLHLWTRSSGQTIIVITVKPYWACFDLGRCWISHEYYLLQCTSRDVVHHLNLLYY